MTNYRSQLVNHTHPGVVCCDTNSSSKLSHREDDICKGLGYILCMHGSVFVQQPATPAALCVLNTVEVLSHENEAWIHTKESRLVIMVACYYLFTPVW